MIRNALAWLGGLVLAGLLLVALLPAQGFGPLVLCRASPDAAAGDAG